MIFHSFFDFTWSFFEVWCLIFHASLPHFLPQNYHFSFIIFGFAEDAHARQSSNKFDLCTHSTASFLTPKSSLIHAKVKVNSSSFASAQLFWS